MNYDFIAIDFEIATNMYNSACSIGLIAVKNNEIVDSYYSLIQPPDNKFNDDTIEVHGIIPKDTETAPKFIDVWNDIKFYFENNTILAHNASFDMNVLRNCLDTYNLIAPNFTYICTIPLSTRACRGEHIPTSLEERCKHFNVELSNHHNALSDAEAAANLIIACIKKKNRKSFESYINTFSSLPIKKFNDLKVQKEFKPRKNNKPKFSHIKISDFTPNCECTKENYFLNKNIVFTGDLELINKKTAMQQVVDLGAVLKSTMSKKVDLLIVGKQDKSIVGPDGMSSKQRKAKELITNGIDITILNETEFLKYLIEAKEK